ncbi:c-type cytochrome [Roseibium sp.]|uniref:c-type cytochrome n=2 Tax=Roseibium sp. TaxID=1936156 RepID=UPI003D139116
MRKVLIVLVLLAGLAGLVAWILSAPTRMGAGELAALKPGDPVRGEQVFWAGGCSACHAAKGAEGEGKFRLGGGLRLKTPFGVFVPPNISTSQRDGIGAWSLADFANALTHGTSPDGRNYYPAFPYTSYARMSGQDLGDLFAFLKTLPAVEGKAPGHDLGFPFNFRRGLGLWKRLYLDPAPVVARPDGLVEAGLALFDRGRYLVEGPGHCGECHTTRDAFGGPVLTAWLGGAAAPDGEGRIPNITPAGKDIATWSVTDIAYYLESGFTPDYDTVGGDMVHVQENIARLPASDREAIAAYLKAVPPVADPAR